MKKHIANIITGSRIIFSLPLVFIPLSSAWFYVFYLFCGFTDMIDGTVARRMRVVSKFGARLDTVADLVFVFVCAIKILPIIHIPAGLWGWIALIAWIKISSVLFVLIRKKKLMSIHSVLNKATGLALFLWPLSLTFVDPTYSVVVICGIATVAVLQEVYLVAKGQEIL